MQKELMVPAGLLLPGGMIEALQKAYEIPRRFYHHFGHVQEVLEHYQLVAHTIGWEHPHEVFCAVLYHDVIYEYGAKDNEIQSAVMAKKELERWLPEAGLDVDYIVRLIELTAKHGKLQATEISEEEGLFLDCDMAILGSNWSRFQRYQEEIEAEYTQIYSKMMYQIGRQRFLMGLKNKSRIFFSDFFHHRLDTQARKNLEMVVKL